MINITPLSSVQFPICTSDTCSCTVLHQNSSQINLFCISRTSGIWSVTGIFVLLKKCPRIKIFRKFLSHGIKYFVLGQKFSEKFCPRTNFFRKFLSYPDKICPTPHRTTIFRKTSKIFILRQKYSENFYPRTKIF